MPYFAHVARLTWPDSSRAHSFLALVFCLVSYGDLSPVTQAGRVFYAAFFLLGTACVAGICKGAVDLYVRAAAAAAAAAHTPHAHTHARTRRCCCLNEHTSCVRASPRSQMQARAHLAPQSPHVTRVLAHRLPPPRSRYIRDVVGDSIVTAIMGSTVNVHLTDMEGDGMVTEADFVLFKLLEMQAVDPVLVDRISATYRRLDTSGEGALDIGTEVPSAAQVAELQRRRAAVEAKGGCVDIMDLWRQMQLELDAFAAGQRSGVLSASLDSGVNLHGTMARGVGASRASKDFGPGRADRASRGSRCSREGDIPDWAVRARPGAARAKKATASTLKRIPKALALGARNASSGTGSAGGEPAVGPLSQGKEFKSLSACHDFAWSRALWRDAASRTGRLAFALFGSYLAVGYLLLCVPEGLGLVDSLYFLSVTLTTTGYGDMAPTSQATRGLAIVLIPLGLIFLTLAVSFVTVKAKSEPKEPDAGGSGTISGGADSGSSGRGSGSGGGGGGGGPSVGNESPTCATDHPGDHPRPGEKPPLLPEQDPETGDDSGGGGGGGDSESGELLVTHLPAGQQRPAEVVWRCGPLWLCGGALGCRFECVTARPEVGRFLKATTAGKLVLILSRLAFVVSVGALFFGWLNSDEAEALRLSPLDAVYFAMVSVTTVGYGDVLPATPGGKAFLAAYLLWGSVVVANVLRDITLLYVDDYIGEGIVGAILASTINVHTADIEGDGRVTEADFVLFKLLEMQAVDAKVLDRVYARYKKLDASGNGLLEVGTEVPSAAQVAELRRRKSGRDGAAAAIAAVAAEAAARDLAAAPLSAKAWAHLAALCGSLRAFFAAPPPNGVSLEELWEEMRLEELPPASAARAHSIDRDPTRGPSLKGKGGGDNGGDNGGGGHGNRPSPPPIYATATPTMSASLSHPASPASSSADSSDGDAPRSPRTSGGGGSGGADSAPLSPSGVDGLGSKVGLGALRKGRRPKSPARAKQSTDDVQLL